MSPKHYSEDDLTLYYYGEGRFRVSSPGHGPRRRVDRHLEECVTCAALFREISSTLAMIGTPGVPERDEQYGLEVWQRIRHRLPDQEASWLTQWFRWDRLSLAGAAGVLMLAAFVAGRTWHHPPSGPSPSVATIPGASGGTPSETAAGSGNGSGNDVQQRILLTSVADHLDRSERVLTDIMNAPDRDDISAEQRWAEDLVTTSRLYRQDAVEVGEESVAGILDELERSLLEIVHSPSKVSAADLEQIRRRIDAAALLFKVRVMSDELRRREERSAERLLPKTSTTKTS